jgi:pimeloyl-ACP methyl ester carboxylesterase
MKYAAVNEDLVISTSGYTLPSTLSLPASDGAAPCVVFFAGSGPTDRDWTSPLLPGKNGSGAQLALGLQARGVGSIRFDKVGSGVNMPKSNAPADLKMLEVLSLAHYVDEATAAFDELASRDRCDPIFLLGHSEGSIHASSAAIAKQADLRFGGLISLSGPSRSLPDTAIEQIRAIRIKAGTDASAVDKALADFRAAMLGPDVSAPDLSALPEAAGLWQVTHDPLQQKVARELIFAEPLAALHAYRGRALVVSAANDAQVRGSEADRIFAALASDAGDKTRVTIANANHVYKTETRAPSMISQGEIVAGYADDDHMLADGLVDAIVGFVTATEIEPAAHVA